MNETEFVQDDLLQRIKHEYKTLLSAKVSDIDAERLIIAHFSDLTLRDGISECHIWLALAQCEWELGRLSPFVKEKAYASIKSNSTMFSSNSSNQLLAALDAPMPPKKKIRSPSYISHCPWPVGSLLAYRIISSTHPNVTQSPFYEHYVLLRIVQIKRHPISRIVPDAAWNESMLVGLYDWIGKAIPDPSIANNLSFTAISINEPILEPSALDSVPIDVNSDDAKNLKQQFIHTLTKQRIETCCDLSWKCVKRIRRDDVFTYLACDPTFQTNFSSFFKTNITDYSMCHSVPFDAVLVNRFSQLMNIRR